MRVAARVILRVTKVTDHACREIRHGRLSREKGKELVDFYQNQSIDYKNLICEWLGVDWRSLEFILDLHKNKNLWYKNEQGNWQIKNIESQLGETDNNEKIKHSFIRFEENASLNLGQESSYITIGKGWP